MSSPKLFQPIKVGNMTLNHRVILAPLTRIRTTPSEAPIPELVKEYYTQRASTPGTLLVSEGTIIASKAHGFPGGPGFWSDEQINGWKEIVDAVHAKGSFIFLQIAALGRSVPRANLQQRDPSFEVVGAGDIPSTGGDFPRPLTHEEIREYVDLYAQAAKNGVEKAGFDGVELHGCNADLIEQFLEDVSNNRSDEYGGSIENRARFVLQVVEAVTPPICRNINLRGNLSSLVAGAWDVMSSSLEEVWNIRKAISVKKTALRLSPWPTFADMGMKDPIPTYSFLVQKLRELFPDLAYLSVIEPRARGAEFEERELSQGESNDFMREIWSPMPLMLAGGYTRGTAIEKAENEGIMIAFGRHFIANPDLPIRLKKDSVLNAYDRSTFYLGTSSDSGPLKDLLGNWDMLCCCQFSHSE
ncbi:NADH:flavin oxidoreductase/NADH oxidase [Dendrothele bispora CBS 962.96]|uniref:NADH:flavin oxidoreductase/NADH oxidase n=1 Tax=Dendrothele bispora (strain CBS 962.96) TaxID=1314807 RepID=A0A4S8MH34_DENBC|nr:NADH:flavin oxidoreductase/NADH oxidase [Dendrothele bispora CBS 962.96]